MGAGRYGALQPTLLSHGIPSLLGLKLPPTVCVHMYTVCVCTRVSCVCTFSLCCVAVVSPGVIFLPCGMHPSMDPLQSLPDAHRLRQYGCVLKKMFYTYRHVHMHPPLLAQHSHVHRRQRGTFVHSVIFRQYTHVNLSAKAK